MLHKKYLAFRAWFYFRGGWSTYFVFLFGAINTLSITYYLAVDNIPIIKDIFPTFSYYIVGVLGIGMPIVMIVGYIHYKKSPSFRSEMDVLTEVDPHLMRQLTIMEITMLLFLEQNNLLYKLIDKDKILDSEMAKFEKTQNHLKKLIQHRSFDWNTVSTVFDSHYSKYNNKL